MDNGGEGVLDIIHNEGDPPSHLNISDVIEAITKADPVYAGVDAMSRTPAPDPLGALRYVRIVEQPASKALRFRYECEGRSAGSIPGVNSTSERKTYPTIEICGHRGPAIVVVSCVTRDEPFKPHPHNLVGRDRCDKGVCTVRTNISDDNRISFSNLGIQCVKRKDVADALAVREKLRVDPFKTGFHHRNQPQTIDLNAVRLCFQVFLPDEATGKIRHSLQPVVSDVIFDKKAMSDLVIMRLSHCSAPPQGGMEMFLLCEKVVREDIAVVFYQKEGEMVVWEETANIQLVHKQYAIAFHVPPYHKPNNPHPVQVYIQLKRISDNARSNPVPFEYIADLQGTPPAARKPLPDLTALAALLKPDGNNNTNTHTNDTDILDADTHTLVTSSSDNSDEIELVDSVESNDAVDGDVIECEIIEEPHTNGVLDNEKSLNDLLEQVAELDEIYSENRTRLENITIVNDTEDVDDFNDAGTYTSLQLAFKNPVSITEPEPYEDVQVQTYRGPIIEFTPLKGGDDDERAPPLPPKRVRKNSDAFRTSQTSVNSILKPGRKLPVTRNRDILAPRSELTLAKSEPALPPAPKKRSFFSRLFRRKEKSPAPSIKSEGQKDVNTKPIGRSVSSVSGIRPSKFKSAISHTSLKDNASAAGLSYADSVTHISLHEDMDEKSSQRSLKRPASLAPLPPTDGGTILVAESVLALDASAFKKLQDDLDLTEAEHYALYMAVAPHATASEFDETSCYYSPVDGSKFHNQ
ncbi:embryonic polarity protein dorsal isoform X1 [Pieris napi]|uniref:embryonic polarity protein dorsal isoform X1 n=2 Tax=Pieris napi TaxID=78633 RepID=UPI001FB8A508|nr:embryonic polarity protein dorsal isoform X1 [Pieris napi]